MFICKIVESEQAKPETRYGHSGLNPKKRTGEV